MEQGTTSEDEHRPEAEVVAGGVEVGGGEHNQCYPSR